MLYAIEWVDQHGGIHWRYFRWKWLARVMVGVHRLEGRNAKMLGWTL